MSESRCVLGKYLLELFSKASTNRKLLEDKWNRNRNAFLRQFDSPKTNDATADRESEDSEEDIYSGVTKTKVVSAISMVVDNMLSKNKVPIDMSLNPFQHEQLADLPPELREIEEENMREAVKLLEQQNEQCKGRSQLISCVNTGAIYARAYAKTFVNENRVHGFEADAFGQWRKVDRVIESPAWSHISVWNMYHDYEVGSLQDGWGVIQREFISSAELREKIGQPFFIDDEIKELLESMETKVEGDSSTNEYMSDVESLPPNMRNITDPHCHIRLLEFWCRVPVNKLRSFEKSLRRRGYDDFADDEIDREGDEVEVAVLMANDKIIRYVHNPDGDRPFFMCDWQSSPEEPLPTGIPDDLEDVQRMSNYGYSTYFENKKVAGDIILAVKRSKLAEDPEKVLNKRGPKVLDLDSSTRTAQEGVHQIKVDDLGANLLEFLSLSEKRADIESQVPKVAQGLSTDEDKTAYETSQQMQQQGKYIGSVIRNFDSLLEDIHLWMFRYNMEDPELTKGKGNYIPKSRGYASFRDKVLTANSLRQALELINSDEELKKKYKTADIVDDLLKAIDCDTDKYRLSKEEEAEQLADAQNSPAVQLQLQAQQLEIESKKSEIEKNNAERDFAINRSQIEAEKLKIEKAKVTLLAKDKAKSSVVDPEPDRKGHSLFKKLAD